MALLRCDQSLGASSPLTKTATSFALTAKLEPTSAKISIPKLPRNNHHHHEPKIQNQLRISPKLNLPNSKNLHLSSKHHPFRANRSIGLFDRPRSSSFICAAASASTCSSAQTLPRVENPKTANTAPQNDKGTSTPRLDDSGPSLPPWNRGGGGGGGGGGNTSGGFFLFGFILILSHLKDVEEKLIERKKAKEEVQRGGLLGAAQ